MSTLKTKSINGVLWTLTGGYSKKIISLIIGIFLARILSPADFGLFGLLTVFFSISMVFIQGGLGSAYIHKPNATDVDANSIFYFNLIMSLLFYIILWFSSPYIAEFYSQPKLIDLLRISAMVIIINSFVIIQESILIKNVDFKSKNLISIVCALISGLIGLLAAILDFGVWSLVIQQLTNSFLYALGIWVFYNWKPKYMFSFTSLKSMFKYSGWILITNLLTSFFNNLNTIVIGKYFPIAQIGFYSKAKNYQTMVTVQPTSSVSMVSFPVFTKLQHDISALKRTMRKFTQNIYFFLTPIITLLLVIAKPLFVTLLTSKWLPMVYYFQLLLLAGILYPLSLMNVKMLNAMGKTKLNFNTSWVKHILRIINIIIMYRFGVVFIIYGEIVVSFLSFIINAYYTNKNINYGFLEQLKDQGIYFFSMFTLFFLGKFLVAFFDNDYAEIVLGTATVFGGYALLQFFLNKEMLLENLAILKSKISRN